MFNKLTVFTALLAGSQLALASPVEMQVGDANAPTVDIAPPIQFAPGTDRVINKARDAAPEALIGGADKPEFDIEGRSLARRRPNAYINAVIKQHNVHRANHSAPKLTWSRPLAKTARRIADTCVYAHNTTADGGGYGQNIAAGVNKANIGYVITDLFYNSEVNNFGDQYGVENPEGFYTWGHFSQIVWKGTTQVGCATKYCRRGLENTGGNIEPYFTVCNYSPPGNYRGEYAENIGESKGRDTVSVGWDYNA